MFFSVWHVPSNFWNMGRPGMRLGVVHFCLTMLEEHLLLGSISGMEVYFAFFMFLAGEVIFKLVLVFRDPSHTLRECSFPSARPLTNKPAISWPPATVCGRRFSWCFAAPTSPLPAATCRTFTLSLVAGELPSPCDFLNIGEDLERRWGDKATLLNVGVWLGVKGEALLG